MSLTPVVVNLEDLKSGKVDDALPDAFGADSLGIIIVSGIDARFKQLRARVLSSASQLAHLPVGVLEKLEDPEAFWLVGWSCGKEKLASGLPDDKKGSFYVNCSFYKDSRLEGPEEHTVTANDLKGYTASNIWPEEKLLPNFQKDLKELICLMIDVAVTVAQACDRYIAKHHAGSVPVGYLEKIVKESNTTKARLLHYFSFEKEQSTVNKNEDDWCGEHVDHSCLTALTSELLLNEDDSTQQEVFVDSSDEQARQAGLHIKNRHGETVKVTIPKDCLAFQTGSALEVISGGQFKAVPHYVKAYEKPGLNRNTLAVFCQPSLTDKVSDSQDFASYARSIIERNH
jgi:isopenicillin N synthase-like dioxygenase